MDLLHSLVALLVASIGSPLRVAPTGSCPEPAANWEAALDTTFYSLPERYLGNLYGREKFEFLPGLFLGNATFTGLDGLQPDRPYQTFCRDNQRVILYSLRSTSPIRMTVPWRLCTGSSGTVGTVGRLVRFEGTITITGTQYAIEPVVPVLLERVSVELLGLGDVMNTVGLCLGHLLSGPVRLFWVDLVSTHVTDAFKRAAHEART
ncbi:unnamed protein product [Ixodes hexagonus]